MKIRNEIKENLEQHKININNNDIKKRKKSKFKSNPVIKPSDHSTLPSEKREKVSKRVN